jgi:hypothetical protein
MEMPAALYYTNDKIAKKETKRAITFTLPTTKEKILGLNLQKKRMSSRKKIRKHIERN